MAGLERTCSGENCAAQKQGMSAIAEEAQMHHVGSDANLTNIGPNQYDQGGDPTGVLALGWDLGELYANTSGRCTRSQDMDVGSLTSMP